MSHIAAPNRLTLAVSLALFGAYAHADDAALPVVNVTAEHRSEDLQKTPLAISAFDEKSLDDKQIRSVRDLSGQVPNLTLSRQSISYSCLLYTSPSPRDATLSRMPSSA